MERAPEPASLQEAIAYFANPDNCREYVVARRWPNGVECPTCGCTDIIFLTNQNRWQCRNKHSKRQFSLKTGTIYEDSPLGLDKWLVATWLVSNCKNGISSCEVARALNVTQKTAWFMDHRIRFSLGMGPGNKLSGQVGVGETFIGGKARNMHEDKQAKKITGTGGKDKAAVMGILERGSKAIGGQVRVKVVGNTKKKTLQSEIRDHVLAGSAVSTDALKSYEGLGEFQHELRQAIASRGVPVRLYMDNGKIYRSTQLARIAASLGTLIVHTPPYQPEGRGKIERFFRSVREQFLAGLDPKQTLTLEQLNERLWHWIDTVYHCREHGALQSTPLLRWQRDIDHVRQLPPWTDLRRLFFHRLDRLVRRDCTFLLHNRFFEAPPHLAGKRLEVRFDPLDLNEVDIYFEGQEHGTARLVDPVLNGQLPPPLFKEHR